MTVHDLIKDLEELPQDAIEVSCFKEVTSAKYSDVAYFLIQPDEYSSGPIVVLE